MIKDAIAKLSNREDLTEVETYNVMNQIMNGEATEAQIAGFLIALKIKGEAIDEITGAARGMRENAIQIKPQQHDKLVDIVGTGGDMSGTFNVSTTCSFVIAGAGVPVAKHGSVGVSSKSGAADVLTALGVNIKVKPEVVEKCIDKHGIGFMFAPTFHTAMKYAAKPRKELATRTIFNILGPLTNPANAPFEMMGVFDPNLTEPLAHVLGNLGLKHALVVHGNGLDELTICGPSKVSELKDGKVSTFEVNSTDYVLQGATIEDLKGGDSKRNAQITTNILKGKERGPKLDIVLLNSAAALYVAGKAESIKEGIEIARKSIESGEAYNKLMSLAEFSIGN